MMHLHKQNMTGQISPKKKNVIPFVFGEGYFSFRR